MGVGFWLKDRLLKKLGSIPPISTSLAGKLCDCMFSESVMLLQVYDVRADLRQCTK